MPCSTLSYVGRKVDPSICYSRLEVLATRITIAINNEPCVSGLNIRKLVYLNGKPHPDNLKFDIFPAGELAIPMSLQPSSSA